MKVMAIIGIVLSSFCFICSAGLSVTPDTYLSAIGWGELGLAYALALSIVTLIKVSKIKKNIEK